MAKNWKKLRQQPKERATFPVQPKDDWVIYETHLAVYLPGYMCNNSSQGLSVDEEGTPTSKLIQGVNYLCS